MEFNSFDEALKHISKAVNNAMNQEVKEETKKTMSKHVKSDVYSYEPLHPDKYTRRKDSGGLSSKSSVDVQVSGGGDSYTLIAKNKATGRNGFSGLAEVTENGTGGNWRGIVPPRKFHENTEKELANGKLQKSLKKGLARQGINAK